MIRASKSKATMWTWLAVGSLMLIGACSSSGRETPRKGIEGPLRHFQLARMHYEQGRVKEALTELEKSLALDDSLPQIHAYLGLVRLEQQDWPRAIAAYQRALELDPYFTDARQQLALCLLESGDGDGALQQLALAAKDTHYLNPESIAFNTALIYRRRGDLDRALSELRKAVGLKPRYYKAHFEMANVLTELKRPEEALLAFVAAEPGYGKDPTFHLRYGAALARTGRISEAMRLLRRAMELAPGSEVAAQASELLGTLG
jgi:type IV pilus assembly protein PilF